MSIRSKYSAGDLTFSTQQMTPESHEMQLLQTVLWRRAENLIPVKLSLTLNFFKQIPFSN